jgi:hypothetical protein
MHGHPAAGTRARCDPCYRSGSYKTKKIAKLHAPEWIEMKRTKESPCTTPVDRLDVECAPRPIAIGSFVANANVEAGVTRVSQAHRGVRATQEESCRARNGDMVNPSEEIGEDEKS